MRNWPFWFFTVLISCSALAALIVSVSRGLNRIEMSRQMTDLDCRVHHRGLCYAVGWDLDRGCPTDWHRYTGDECQDDKGNRWVPNSHIHVFFGHTKTYYRTDDPIRNYP